MEGELSRYLIDFNLILLQIHSVIFAFLYKWNLLKYVNNITNWNALFLNKGMAIQLHIIDQFQGHFIAVVLKQYNVSVIIENRKRGMRYFQHSENNE